MTGGSVELAHAKINLALHILGQRQDGYHELDSLVCFASCADQLTAISAETDRLTITGPFAEGLLNDGANLVLRAVSAFRDQWPGRLDHGFNIRLAKNLPIASGIGGGSADAAAALRLMAALAGDMPVSELASVAGLLGADVPVCLRQENVRMKGTGAQTSPIPKLPRMHMVLVNPRIQSTTPSVFAALHQRENPPLAHLPAHFESAAHFAEWLKSTRNDLEAAAVSLVPQIAEITDALYQSRNCLFARMSGSGATVFGLYETQAHAARAASAVSTQFPRYWVAPCEILANHQ